MSNDIYQQRQFFEESEDQSRFELIKTLPYENIDFDKYTKGELLTKPENNGKTNP